MELTAKNREILGKKVKSLRREGFIPAELFGRGLGNRHLAVSEKEFNKIYGMAGEHTLINVLTEGGEKLPALITDVSREPISGKLLSIDLHQVKMDEKIQAKVPIEFTGVAPAVKSGFVVVKVLKEIEVEALPASIPPKFEINLSGLEKAGDGIDVKDIKVPNGVEILSALEAAIVTVTEKQKEEVAPPPPAETAAAEAAAAEGANATAPAVEKSAKEEK